MSASSLIPVHILTGFLGSGKTTLLNRTLDSGFGSGTAVLVNEFGAVGLDQLFLQGASEEQIVLPSGCICCTIRGDLPRTLLELIGSKSGSRRKIVRVVVETSGLSEPLPILQTLRADSALRARFRPGAIVCTVSALDSTEIIDRSSAYAQLTAADAFVLTKRDLADESVQARVRAIASAANPIAEWLPNRGASLAAWLDSAEQSEPTEIVKAGEDDRAIPFHMTPQLPTYFSGQPAPHSRIRSLVLRAAHPASWARFAVWITRLIYLHGDRILRVKGILHDVERDVWIGIHCVKRYFHPPVHLRLTQSPKEGATIVFITDALDPALIERSYRSEVLGSTEIDE